MNHQPFEEWLLDDKPLDPEQQRELQNHMRTCESCTAVAESNLALRTARLVGPAPGFSARWQVRLVTARESERRRARIGTLVFTLGGLALLALLAGPTLLSILEEPAEWIAMVVQTLLFSFTLLAALVEASSILLRVIPSIVPPFAWLVLFSAMSGLGLLGSISIWRLTRLPQGVQQ